MDGAQASAGDAPAKPRVLLLFDINGVLTNRTPSRHEASYRPRKHNPRPYIEQLLRLQGHFQLGIYSSAMPHTIQRALGVIEDSIQEQLAARQKGVTKGVASTSEQQQEQQEKEEQEQQDEEQQQEEEQQQQEEEPQQQQQQGEPLPPLRRPLFTTILTRRHCRPDPKWRTRSDGKEWDTVKPLALHGFDLSTTVLVDNDDYKALLKERTNMLLVPHWEDDDVSDADFPLLVDLMLERLEEAEDVREVIPKLVAEFEARRVAAHGEEAHPQLSQHYVVTPEEEAAEEKLLEAMEGWAAEGEGQGQQQQQHPWHVREHHVPAGLQPTEDQEAAEEAAAVAAGVSGWGAGVVSPVGPPGQQEEGEWGGKKKKQRRGKQPPFEARLQGAGAGSWQQAAPQAAWQGQQQQHHHHQQQQQFQQQYMAQWQQAQQHMWQQLVQQQQQHQQYQQQQQQQANGHAPMQPPFQHAQQNPSGQPMPPQQQQWLPVPQHVQQQQQQQQQAYAQQQSGGWWQPNPVQQQQQGGPPLAPQVQGAWWQPQVPSRPVVLVQVPPTVQYQAAPVGVHQQAMPWY